MGNIIKILLSILLFSNLLLAQKEANNWYFGYKNGLTFNKSDTCLNPPCPIYDGKLTSDEGFSAISDSNGELLFYAEGERVWNRNHEIMENGDGIFGHKSATQSTLIVPLHNNPGLYYLFTVDGMFVSDNYCGEKGFNYSIIDINQNNGLGKVTNKNINLLPDCTEKLAAVKNINCDSYWVIMHEWENDAFCAYLINKSGLSEPIISNIGSIHGNNDSCQQCRNKGGLMKISSLGNKVAVAINCDAFIEIFDFDNKSGKLSNCIIIKDDFFKNIYGIEFSPDGQYLYIYNGYNVFSDCDVTGIYQYNISYKNIDEILNSKCKVKNLCWSSAGMQLGPDGKLYIAYWMKPKYTIDIIEKPNEKCPDCNFKSDAINLQHETYGGFPNFISSYFAKNQVSLPDTIAKVGNEISIPITININCACVVNDSGYFYKAEIEYDATFFYPYFSPIITGNKVVNGQRILTLEGEFKPETLETIVAEISGLVLLGKDTKTPLKINKFEILNSDINIETQDGSLEIYGVCQPELSQIELLEPLRVDLTPNPAEDLVKLSFHTIIENDVRISFSNYMGNTVKEFNLNVDVLQKTNEAELDVLDLPSGLYFATIRAGGQIQTEKILILR
ncbi:MAG: T9SS type A sorting domain-containing protein [bacterium]